MLGFPVHRRSMHQLRDEMDQLFQNFFGEAERGDAWYRPFSGSHPPLKFAGRLIDERHEAPWEVQAVSAGWD